MSISLDQAEKMMKEALFVGWDALQKAGEEAKQLQGKQIDITTKGDEIVGNAVIEFLRSRNIPLVIYTEEKGETDVNITPDYPILIDDVEEATIINQLRASSHSVVFDDIDGTKNFKEGRNMLPYGTILGVFETADPTFDQCLAAGFLDFPSGNLYSAVRGQGTNVIERFAYGGKNVERVRTSGRKSITADKPLTYLADSYMLGRFAPYFAKYSAEGQWPGDFRSKAAHLAMVADGSADLFITADACANPKKRATGEELGPGYLLIKEAGGSTLSWSGYDIANQKVGLGTKDTFDVIVASSEKLAKEIWEEMNLMPEIEHYVQRKYYSGK